MPALDQIHEAVKHALIKDGWSITADPYVIEYEDVRLFADLGAIMAGGFACGLCAFSTKWFFVRCCVRSLRTSHTYANATTCWSTRCHADTTNSPGAPDLPFVV